MASCFHSYTNFLIVDWRSKFKINFGDQYFQRIDSFFLIVPPDSSRTFLMYF